MGAIVVLGVHDLERGEKYVYNWKNKSNCFRRKKEIIIKETKNENIYVLYLNLADLKSVEDFAVTFLNTGMPLHMLINNAGIQ